MKIIPAIAQAHDEIQALRRDIHAHPELCYEEERTAGRRRAKAAGMGHRSHARAWQDGRRRRVAPGFGQARDRPARRHGRAADPRAQYVRACVAARGQDARMRPRRPYRDAARRGAVSVEASQFRRHRRIHLPAGRRRRRRRERDDRRRSFQALSRSMPCSRCTTGRACRRASSARASARRRRRATSSRSRIKGVGAHAAMPHDGVDPVLHGDADRHGPAEHHDAQQAADRRRPCCRSRRSTRARRPT